MSVIPMSGGASARLLASVAHLFPFKVSVFCCGFRSTVFPDILTVMGYGFAARMLGSTVLFTAAKCRPLDLW